MDVPRSAAIAVADAEKIILTSAGLAPTESLPIDAAAGRILREDIRADRDFPPFNRVAMDGIAFAYDSYRKGIRKFCIRGVQSAGSPPLALTDSEGCIEVMTGAVLPEGCDCVVPVEGLQQTEASAEITGNRGLSRFQNVHRRGSDNKTGEVLISAGTRLRSPELAVCATVGKTVLTVSSRSSVAVVSTGDELVEIDRVPEPHQIRVSNSYAIESALSRSGRARTERFHSADDLEELEQLLANLLARFDLLVVTGGVSTGKFDLVPSILERMGVRTLFRKVAQRPGYPFLFGVSEEKKAVFALPGNPVSALLSTHRYIIPFLARRAGGSETRRGVATLSEDYIYKGSRTLFLPVKTMSDKDGLPVVRPVLLNGSGDLAGLIASDGFIELPPNGGGFAAGTAWPFIWWE